MKDTGLKGIIKRFFADFNRTDTSDVLDTHKYLMKGTWHKLISHLLCNMRAIKNVWLNLLLLIYILMNRFKNFTTIHLRLS